MSIFDTEKTIHFSGALRCAEKQYNDALVKRGCIKFGLPQKWVEDGKKYGPGRGDVLEGTFATCNILDIENLIRLCSSHKIPNDNTVCEMVGNRIYYKRKQSLSLPVFCLYGIKFDIFNIAPQIGWQKVKGTIPAEYFKSFSNIVDNENTLPVERQPSIVVITDLDEFRRRLLAKLESIGIEEDEIIASPILYYDFNRFGPLGWIDIDKKPPLELTVKDKSFENQSEVRFIVNSKNTEAMEYLRNNSIDIGGLEDIAQNIDGYFKEGIDIEMKIDVEEK